MLLCRPFARASRSLPRALFHCAAPHYALKRFKLADIGEGITECEVIKWSVKPFTPVNTFDPLCEVQSDKASVEITSPFDGIIKELLVEEGQVAKVGQDLCTIEVVDDLASTTDSPPPAPYETSEAKILATPSVRHYARQHNVDLRQLHPGTGRAGRIEKRDIDGFLQAGPASAPAATGRPGSEIVVELNRTRQNMWKAMEKSLAIPQFSCSSTLDLTELHRMLPLLNAHIPRHYLPAASHQREPRDVISPDSFYVSPVPHEAEHDLRPHADISLALSTPTGLYTPTLQAADTQSVYELASRVKHVAHLGRQVPCALTPQDMPRRGGTVSVSNVGGIGAVDSAVPVLVPGGGVAIVAVGRAKWVWDVDRGDGKGERRLIVGMSWSADHRVVEGAEMVAFMQAWRNWVEVPQRMIADGL
ncbi:CoA-dependent acyltransferase [Epithele typhae]|uniref:CoA-dependent acyltransferase n=1 Tax=Epithele typhae TaxID=378194 RepID=UPI0020072A7F|nr:CoA-dependent acyltransferase [Epithele typhae]KAH9927410.1 CoA-dependent acyltransferase [Epithele typhae]